MNICMDKYVYFFFFFLIVAVTLQREQIINIKLILSDWIYRVDMGVFFHSDKLRKKCTESSKGNDINISKFMIHLYTVTVFLK